MLVHMQMSPVDANVPIQMFLIYANVLWAESERWHCLVPTQLLPLINNYSHKCINLHKQVDRSTVSIRTRTTNQSIAGLWGSEQRKLEDINTKQTAGNHTGLIGWNATNTDSYHTAGIKPTKQILHWAWLQTQLMVAKTQRTSHALPWQKR